MSTVFAIFIVFIFSIHFCSYLYFSFSFALPPSLVRGWIVLAGSLGRRDEIGVPGVNGLDILFNENL